MKAKLGRQLRQPLHSRAFLTSENPSGQGVRRQGREKACEDSTEIAVECAGYQLGQGIGDEPSSVSIHCRFEERLLRRKVDVHGAGREPGLAGNARHGRTPATNGRELGDRLLQHGLAGPYSLARGYFEYRSGHANQSIIEMIT